LDLLINYGTYILNGSPVAFTDAYSDLGILFDSHLDHTSVAAAKANCVQELISKSFEYLDPTMLNRSFKTIVHPILEYGNAIWIPNLSLINEKLKKFNAESLALSLSSNYYPMQNSFLL